MITILGIDPGSRVCGYGVIRCGGRGELRYVECGVLTAPAAWPAERRLGEIARGLAEVVDEFTPACLAVEDVFAHAGHGNVRSALSLAQARGMALAIAGLRGLPVFSYAPALVKKSVVGTGRAGKEQVARMVAGLIGLAAAPRADAADALAVAIAHGRGLAPGGARLVPAVIAAAVGGDS
ncbi:MAG: crossover junction endodeoxyribonuclease RuvC [Kofleriaceae bacterium]